VRRSSAASGDMRQAAMCRARARARARTSVPAIPCRSTLDIEPGKVARGEVKEGGYRYYKVMVPHRNVSIEIHLTTVSGYA
jgi:hypothetical protein